MKLKTLIVAIFVVFVFAINVRAECFPRYVCEEWGACDDGLKSRICKDVNCDKRDLIERDFCVENCTPKISCSEWGECVYTDKIDDLISGEIKFGGYRNRLCQDVNDCVESFYEEGLCEESYKLDVKKVEKCGEDFLLVSDPGSNKQIAKISLSSLQEKRLDLSIILAESRYCVDCYNGVKDKYEEKVDCGGDCKPCNEKLPSIMPKIAEISSWIIASMFTILFMAQLALYLKNNNKSKTKGRK